MDYGQVILKSGKDQSVKRYHPWIFSGAIKKTLGNFREGDVVQVFNNKEEFLGLGHYQPATIAVRIISFENRPIDEAFWREKLSGAMGLRKQLGYIGNEETNVFRLVNAEGDGFPGLIIDYYNGVAVMQAHSVGMYRNKELFAEILKDLLGNSLLAVYDKSSSSLPYNASVEKVNRYIFGNPADQLVKENGMHFYVNWEEGQKTGFFIDQREHRRLLKNYAQNARVLNLFGYTGGFSVYAAAGGCKRVVSVDSSSGATELAEKNMKLNFDNHADHYALAREAFSYLRNTEEQFDIIILDPPAFAKHHKVLPNALQGYKKLNRLALEKVQPGGLIFTFSCSQVVSREEFRKTVFTASANTGRRVRILHQLSQPADHPVSVYHPEGEYLKGLVLRVE
ncbi:MAG: class I SAM-dependent rRNA methyltransferase [Bacteroidales bacterium]|nr:class I SAM-dependent rRNA methyltransferase [Bacteroidales bacterium]